MKFPLLFLFVLTSLGLTAQKPRFDFNHGMAASLKYSNDLYRDGGGGVKAEMGYLTQLTVGRRLRGRIGIGASAIINHSTNTYKNIVTRLGRLRFDRDTLYDLRTGSLATNFLAITVPLEYRFVSDGRIPWSVGISYQPGLMLVKSAGNAYTQYDLLSTSRQRINEAPRGNEKTTIKPFTQAVSLNFGYETDHHLLRLTLGRDHWENSDGFIVEEFHWLLGFEIIKWFQK